MSLAANLANTTRNAAANAGNMERDNAERKAKNPNAQEAKWTDVWSHTYDGLTQPMSVGDALLNATPAGAVLGTARGLAAGVNPSPPEAMPAALGQAWDQTVADFKNISKAEGALQTIGATMGALTSVEQMLSVPLSMIPFPAFPAVRITDMDIGLPHAHMHPPNLIPPAPPVPLPSTGPLIPIPFLSGASKTLINGLPAARCGDMGLGIWCGGYFPMYEIFLGSSSVWIEGARAARVGVDITKHCIFTSPRPQDPPLGPMIGFTITSSFNVVVGGIPMPSLLGFAMGKAFQAAFKGLSKAIGAARRAGAKVAGYARKGKQTGCWFPGHPIDPSTGASVDDFVDYDFAEDSPLKWTRNYSSRFAALDSPMGKGFRHGFQHELKKIEGGWLYTDPNRQQVGFPTGDVEHGIANDGLRLQATGSSTFEIAESGKPTLVFEFDGQLTEGTLTQVKHADGMIRFTYNEKRWLTSATDGIGHQFRFRYDDHGHIVEIERHEPGEKSRRIATYEYDQAGSLLSWTDAIGNRASHGYDLPGRMTRTTDRRGYSFRYEYDAHGRCIHTYGDDGLYDVRLEYSPAERMTTAVYADGATTVYLFNENNDLIERIDPDGGSTVFVTDAAGKTQCQVDPLGNATKFLHDSWGGNTGRLGPLGQRAAPLDQDLGLPNPLAYSLPETVLQWEHGERLRHQSITPPIQEDPVLRQFPVPVVNQIISFDPVSAVETHGSANPAKRKQYDAMRRPLKETHARGETEAWTYDAEGNPVEHRDRDGSLWRYAYKSWNLLEEAIQPTGGRVRYDYTIRRSVREITDPGGTVSQYDYDLNDRIVAVHRHGKVRERYQYDQGGNIVGKTASDGRKLLTFEFGTGNVPIERRLHDGETQTFEYDDLGRLVNIANQDLKATFAYDDFGRAIEDQRDGEGVAHEFEFGDLAKTIYFGQFEVGYEPQDDGSVLITDPTGKQHRLEYSSHGLTAKQLSNGTTELCQFDRQGRCLRKAAIRGDKTIKWNRKYRYTPGGNLAEVVEGEGANTNYKHDPAGRLLYESLPDGSAYSYEHDLADNLVGLPGVGELAVSRGNRLESAGEARFEYNDRDHMSRREEPGKATDYFYNSLDMLVRCVINGQEWHAKYDPMGRRVEKTWRGQTTRFFWDDFRLSAEVRHDGSVRLYIYADHAALVPFMFVQYDSLEADPEAGDCYFIFTNQIGTPIRVEDEAGAVVWNARVEPYGLAHVGPGSKIDMPLRFPGHYHDAETGLHYNRFRYYDPRLGRYLQSDPIGVAGGLNLYAYNANPLTEVDLDGLGCDDVIPDNAKTKIGNTAEDAAPQGGFKPRPGPPATPEVKNAAVEDMVRRFGMPEPQARAIVDGAMDRGSDVVVGGSRVRGNAKPGSDIDIGYNGLTTSQADKVTRRANKIADATEGGIPVEKTKIVPGNKTDNIPEIESAEEFFSRRGTRTPPDPKAGQPIEPSGHVRYGTDGSITEVKPPAD